MTVKTITLPNGLKIVYQKSISEKEITNIQAFCDVGSIHEPDDLRGAAHFIEHMCFKGTVRHPDFIKIYSVYDRIGAYINASTDKRFTKYSIICATKSVKNILTTLADMLLRSIFKPSDFSIEEKIVIEENRLYDIDPIVNLFNGADSMLYNGTNYSTPIDSISYHKAKFDRNKIIQFYKTHYTPNRIVLSIVSQIPFDKICRYVMNTHFSQPSIKSECIYPPPGMVTSNPTKDIQYKIIKSTGTFVSIGFKIDRIDKYTLTCLGVILSGPMSARLWKILRDDAGMSYNVSADCTTYEKSGDFFIYSDSVNSTIVANGSKPGVLPLLIKLINDLISDGVNQTELDVAKGYLNGTLTRNSEKGEILCDHNGEQSILFPGTQIVQHSDIYSEYFEHMDISTINACIHKYFRREFMSVCITSDIHVNLRTIKSICDRIK